MEINSYHGKLLTFKEIFCKKYDKFTLDLLQGLDRLGSSNISIKKGELNSYKAAFEYLSNIKFWNNFSLETDVYLGFGLGGTKCDFTIFARPKSYGENKDEENKLIWIDIECKTMEIGNPDFQKVKSDLLSQIEKHKDEFIPNHYPKCIPFVIGFIDDSFQIAYFDNEKIDNISDLLNKSIALDGIANSNDSLIVNLENLGSFNETIFEIGNGKFKLHKEVARVSKNIENKVGNCKAIICLAPAGYGKTAVGFNLFINGTYPTRSLLLLNKKFYYYSYLNSLYPKAFFGSEKFIESIDSNTFSIVDECQRLTKEKLLEIVKKSKTTLLLGDNNQAFYYGDNFMDAKELVKWLSDNNIESKIIKLRQPKRYGEDVQILLESLTKSTSERPKLSSDIDFYKIKISDNENNFVSDYEKDNNKRMFMPTKCVNGIPSINIGGRKFDVIDHKDNIFDHIESDVIGDTFHAISFDVDNDYVYLPNTCLGKLKNKTILTNEICQTDEDKLKYLNELNVLFTRGTKSLHIFFGDVLAYLFARFKLIDKGYKFRN